MRIEIPRESERLGSLRFFGAQKTFLLDSGMADDEEFANPFFVVQRVTYEQLHEVEKRMAIVIPIKDEKLKLLEGILSAIPSGCMAIIVSNSEREPTDRFMMETQAVDDFCKFAKRKYMIIHQKDTEFADAITSAGYPDILGKDGTVKSGKAEGMIMGIILAKLAGKDYVGFIDSDNYFPGSVFEYVRIFSATMALSKSPYSMTRIIWNSKPKVKDSQLYFAKWGRVSRITNDYLNKLISVYKGADIDVIKTGNAGEHVLTTQLAMKLNFGADFSVETAHFTDMMEKFGGIIPSQHPDVMKKSVEIFQVESRNPHLHEVKPDEHVEDMILQSLMAIYHSHICPEEIKREIVSELKSHGINVDSGRLKKGSKYRALEEMNFDALREKFDYTQQSNFHV